MACACGAALDSRTRCVCDFVEGHSFTVRIAHADPAMAAEVARAIRLLVRSIALSSVDVRGATVTATEVEADAWPAEEAHPAPPRPMEPGESLRVGPVLPPPARPGKMPFK